VRGSEGSMVSAGGNLRAHHVESARVDSAAVLEVSDAVNAKLSAVHVRIEHSLRGGHAAVEIGLVTRDAGTSTAIADTIIEAGVPREDPAADARVLLVAAKAQRMGARLVPGPRAGIGERGKGGRLARELGAVRETELARKIERAERIAALLPRAFVEIRGSAHAGVDVRIGEARLLLQETAHNVRFTLDVENQTIRSEGVTK